MMQVLGPQENLKYFHPSLSVLCGITGKNGYHYCKVIIVTKSMDINLLPPLNHKLD